MKRDPIQDGTHTWDLYLKYYSCPQCGYIIEDRQPYRKRTNDQVKQIHCRRCGNEFITVKNQQSGSADV